MFESRDRVSEDQQEFWVETRRLPKATASTFYRKLDDTLIDIGFIEDVREICRPAYADAAKGGRPGIDPAVYFKMLNIGFFENLPSERSIASRCADSLSLRAFLGYELDERAPDHSSLTIIRQRLAQEFYQGAFELVLTGDATRRREPGQKTTGSGADLQSVTADAPSHRHRNTEAVVRCGVLHLKGKPDNADMGSQGIPCPL